MITCSYIYGSNAIIVHVDMKEIMADHTLRGSFAVLYFIFRYVPNLHTTWRLASKCTCILYINTAYQSGMLGTQIVGADL